MWPLLQSHLPHEPGWPGWGVGFPERDEGVWPGVVSSITYSLETNPTEGTWQAFGKKEFGFLAAGRGNSALHPFFFC